MQEQEIGRKDAHENLMDSNRPSVIAGHFRSLYLKEYGELDYKLQETMNLTEKQSAIILVNIIEVQRSLLYFCSLF